MLRSRRRVQREHSEAGPRSYQVRVALFAQTVPTREAAEKLELEFKLRRVGGDGEVAADDTRGGDRWVSWRFALRRASSAKHRVLRAHGEGVETVARARVSALRRVQVEDFISARAAEHPRSAIDELQFLKRVLRDAKGRGQRIDEAVLEIRPVKHSPRRGRAFTVE